MQYTKADMTTLLSNQMFTHKFNSRRLKIKTSNPYFTDGKKPNQPTLE